MYELRQAAGRSWYIDSPVRVGVVEVENGGAVLIDSGLDKEAGRKARQALDRQGWRLEAICNTHSNADHIGGNQYLQGVSGCRIFAPAIEAAFIRHPILEPSFLWGGFPIAALRHKFLLAQSSEVTVLTPENIPAGLELIELPGHFFNMAGFRTRDDVVFLADCLVSEEVLEKYRIPFIYDVAAWLATLERVKDMRAALFVPAHAAPCTDPGPLAQANIAATLAIGDDIVALLATPMTFEKLLAALFARYGLTMSAHQYVLVGSTVRSYLAWLEGQKRVHYSFASHEMVWSACAAGAPGLKGEGV